MSLTITAPVSEPVKKDDDDDQICHWICECNENIALCGLDVSGLPWDMNNEDEDCVLCQIVAEEQLVCKRCGEVL
jgi:hypothetical protein